MEVKGIGQKLSKTDVEVRGSSRFEEVFDDSRKKVEEAKTGSVPGSTSVSASAASGQLDGNQGADTLFAELKSPYINNSPLFMTLKAWLADFNRELREKVVGPDYAQVQDYELRVTLYDCLMRLLREIVMTTDRTLQMNYLQRVYDWFIKRQNQKRKYVPAPEKPPALHKYVMDVPPKRLYDQRMRTLHPEIPPPRERLLDYRHKAVVPPPEAKVSIPAEEPIEIPSPPLIPPRVGITGGDWARRERKAAKVEAKSSFLYYEPLHPEEQKMERLWLAQKNKEIAGKRATEELHEALQCWGHAKERLNENLLRKHENTNQGNNFAIRNYRRRSCGRRPRVLNSTHIDYKAKYEELSSESEEEGSPSQARPTVKSSQKLRRHKLPAITDLRENAEPPESKVCPPPLQAIQNSDKRRVDYIRKVYGQLIGATDDKMAKEEEPLPKDSTLSLFRGNRGRSCTSHKRERMTTHTGEREHFRMQQLSEITQIKEHLAKEDVPCSVVALQRAILIPEDYPACRMTAENFLRPGCRLYVNPFAKPKKKAKKRKKGKH